MTTQTRAAAASLLVLAALVAGCSSATTEPPSATPSAEPSASSPAAAPSALPSALPSAVTSSSAPPPEPISPEQASSEALSTQAPVLITPSPSATASSSASASAGPGTGPWTDDRPAEQMPQNPIGMSPLDGLPIAAYDPVLIMKLDNTSNAQPHAGLTEADIVYLEEVEYGITRIAAVFSSHVPRRIGPIRSARITDIDLVAQYGKPAFGYSGAQRKMFPYLAAASIYDVSPNRSAGGYSRDNQRRAPYNLYFDGTVGQQKAPKASKVKDIGFVFSEVVPAGGLRAKTATMKWGYASAGFTYDEKAGTYRVSLNGQDARAEESSKGQRASTVVIQYVKQTKSQFWDKGGGNTPHAQTIGSGRALVLRDGLMWETTWRRPNAKSGTTFTLPDGTLMPFKPGQPWIVLLDKKRPATVKPLTRPKPVASAAPSASATAASPAPDLSPSPGVVPSASASGQ